MASADGFYMSIAPALESGPSSKSFEEVRIEDYLKSIQSTGRVPQACPQDPKDAQQRAALGLPPLFLPQPISTTGAGSSIFSSFHSAGDGRNQPRISDPAQLPASQVFAMSSIAGEKFMSICCMSAFEGFSPEEMRCYAYLLGNKTSPTPIALSPFGALPTDEQMQTLAGSPPYEKHSSEELRIAYLIAGRELTTAEIVDLKNPLLPAPSPELPPPPPAPTSTLPPTAPTGLLARPSATGITSFVPPPIYASTSSIPKFSFGTR